MKALLLAGSAAAAMLVASPDAQAEHRHYGGRGHVQVSVHGGGYGGHGYSGGYRGGYSSCPPVYSPPVCHQPVYRTQSFCAPVYVQPAPRVIYYSQPTYYGRHCDW